MPGFLPQLFGDTAVSHQIMELLSSLTYRQRSLSCPESLAVKTWKDARSQDLHVSYQPTPENGREAYHDPRDG